jgi:hypothetical protein
MTAPSRSLINRLFNNFETSGSVTDNKKVVAKIRAVRATENIHCVEQAMMQRPRESAKVSLIYRPI